MIDSIAAVNGNFSCGKEVFVCYKQAGLATALAEADISLFALFTYDTDYVFNGTDLRKDALLFAGFSLC